MLKALETFRESLDRVRMLHALHQNFGGLVAPIVDLSDLLRSEIVLIISALDFFIHEIARIGMMETWSGNRPPTSAYLKYDISLDVSTQLSVANSSASILEAEIRTRHGYLSFQHPDKIADAVRLYSNVELWNAVGALLGENPKALKTQLKLLVERRNKIAHEADLDPSYPGQRWPISRRDTEEALAFVNKIGEAIYTVSV